MKIIIPNAKELNTNLENSPFQPLSDTSKVILEVIGQYRLEELARFYKLSVERVQLEVDRWHRIKTGQAKTYPAWQLYDGLMYRYMDRRGIDSKEENYLRDHVRVATALYGLIHPFEFISPHRLDFQGSLKIGNQSLKQYWRPYYDQEVGNDELILSLASSEFEQVFSPQIQKRLVKILFMEEKAGQLKVHSTISKKGRGRLLSWLAKNNIQKLSDIQDFKVDGFEYCASESTANQLTFIRSIKM
ncbi:TPA: peroxide stress protein YaaA [Streptococcus suis]